MYLCVFKSKQILLLPYFLLNKKEKTNRKKYANNGSQFVENILRVKT